MFCTCTTITQSQDPALLIAAWPHPRALLLFQLWRRLYPTTDRRHPVITPMHTLQAAYLSLCPVANHKQAAMGLFVASVVAQDMGPVRRVAPEPLCFAVNMLRQLAPAAEQACSGGSGGSGDVMELDLAQVMACPADDAFFAAASFRVAVLAVAVRVVRACADAYGDVAAAPELFSDALGALEALLHNPHNRHEVRTARNYTIGKSA